MSWDDTKITGGSLTASEYNNMVTDQKTRIGSVIQDPNPSIGSYMNIDNYGFAKTFVANEVISGGLIGYVNNSGKMSLSSASVLNTAIGMLGAAVGNIGSNTSGVFVLEGLVPSTSLTVGSPYFLSAAGNGAVLPAAPSGNDNIARVAGYAISGTALWFKPDNTWVVVSGA